MRSLYLNLKAVNNPSLREDVVSGEISVARLYGMSPAVSCASHSPSPFLPRLPTPAPPASPPNLSSTTAADFGAEPQEMASEEQQAVNRKLVEENLFKAQGAAPQQAETDAFQCGKCKERRTIYYQVRFDSSEGRRRRDADVIPLIEYRCRREVLMSR